MKTPAALADLLFLNQTRRKVLAWLLMHPDQSIHLRELARQTQAAPGTLKKEVDALCRVGLLHGQRIGNQVQVQVNRQHPVFAELQALVRKTIGLTDVLLWLRCSPAWNWPSCSAPWPAATRMRAAT